MATSDGDDVAAAADLAIDLAEENACELETQIRAHVDRAGVFGGSDEAVGYPVATHDEQFGSKSGDIRGGDGNDGGGGGGGTAFTDELPRFVPHWFQNKSLGVWAPEPSSSLSTLRIGRGASVLKMAVRNFIAASAVTYPDLVGAAASPCHQWILCVRYALRAIASRSQSNAPHAIALPPTPFATPYALYHVPTCVGVLRANLEAQLANINVEQRVQELQHHRRHWPTSEWADELTAARTIRPLAPLAPAFSGTTRHWQSIVWSPSVAHQTRATLRWTVSRRSSPMGPPPSPPSLFPTRMPAPSAASSSFSASSLTATAPPVYAYLSFGAKEVARPLLVAALSPPGVAAIVLAYMDRLDRFELATR
jgi:hypothetical protein